MRTEAELDAMYKRVAQLLEANPDEEVLDAIYETLRWVDGLDASTTIEEYFPID